MRPHAIQRVVPSLVALAFSLVATSSACATIPSFAERHCASSDDSLVRAFRSIGPAEWQEDETKRWSSTNAGRVFVPLDDSSMFETLSDLVSIESGVWLGRDSGWALEVSERSSREIDDATIASVQSAYVRERCSRVHWPWLFEDRNESGRLTWYMIAARVENRAAVLVLVDVDPASSFEDVFGYRHPNGSLGAFFYFPDDGSVLP